MTGLLHWLGAHGSKQFELLPQKELLGCSPTGFKPFTSLGGSLGYLLSLPADVPIHAAVEPLFRVLRRPFRAEQGELVSECRPSFRKRLGSEIGLELGSYHAPVDVEGQYCSVELGLTLRGPGPRPLITAASGMKAFQDRHKAHDAPSHVGDERASNFSFSLEILPPAGEPRCKADSEGQADQRGEERKFQDFDHRREPLSRGRRHRPRTQRTPSTDPRQDTITSTSRGVVAMTA